MESINWSYVLTHFLLPALVAGVSLFVTLLLNAAKAYVDRQSKSDLHWVAASICLDAVTAVMPLFIDSIKDGKIDPDEKRLMIEKARAIAKPRLEALTGFAKDKLGKWLDDELEIALGKLLSGLGLSLPAATPTIGPDDPAQ